MSYEIIDDTIKEVIEVILEKIQLELFQEAEEICHHTLKCDEENIQVLQLLALIYQKTDRNNEAIHVFNKLLKSNTDAEWENSLALCYASTRDFNSSVKHLYRAISLRPEYAHYWNNLGMQLRIKKQFEDAISCFKIALDIEKDAAQIWVNLAGAYGELLDIDNGIACLTRALELDPNNSAAHVDLGCALFLLGNWKQGWKEYNHRFEYFPHLKNKVANLDKTKEWKGEDISSDKTIFVFCEQGIGDTFNFIRFIKPLKEKYGCKVNAVVPSETYDLLSNTFEITQKIGPHDYYCSAINLPFLLDWNKEPCEPYIKSNKKCHLSKYYPNIMKVGICWAGNPRHPRDEFRSFSLSNFRKLQMPGIKLFSLQKDLRGRKWPLGCVDLSENCEDMNVVDMSEHMKDWNATASIIADLDLIITTDTSVLHLAGAMGKKTWGIIPFLPDWRWGIGGTNTFWYPSLRLFKQKKLGIWDDVFSELYKALSVEKNSYFDLSMIH